LNLIWVMPAEEVMTRAATANVPGRGTSTIRVLAALLVLTFVAASCGDDDGVTITLLAHDSFALSDETLAAFTDETGIDVEILQSGDTGTMVAEAILTAGNPLADVMFGIDSTFLQRGLDADLFAPYESDKLPSVPDEFELDGQHRVTPIDYGDVCVNYWIDAVPGAAPASLDDLAAPDNQGQLVVQNPETSSPGLAFLLATIAAKGEAWEQYWTDLRANDVTVTSGWEDAYNGEFVAGGGSRSMVVSYASSPPAEVLFADPPVQEAPTGVVLDSCFRQVEFAGVLRGTQQEPEAQQLIDFMLSSTFQEDLPLSMFVFPVVEETPLPPEFVEHAAVPSDPLTLDPAEIEANRDAWTERWVEIVLG
jgi:thiamine transport system substrate-binding protein